MIAEPLNCWWHELNTWEPEAALAFYSRALGWEFDPTETADGGGYWIAKLDGKPVGGIYELKLPDYDGVPSHWMTYLSVREIEAATLETVKAGGDIVRPTVKIGGVGKLAVVTDAGGAYVGLIEHELPRVPHCSVAQAA